MSALAPLERLTPLHVSSPIPSDGLSTRSAQRVRGTEDGSQGAEGFGQILSKFLGSTSQADADANRAIQALANGEAEDVHTASLAMAQADLSFRLALEIRNRLQEAVQEIFRLQV